MAVVFRLSPDPPPPGECMLLSTVLLGAALVMTPPSVLGPKNDVLYMKNGDKLTCEIKSMDAGAIYVSLDYVNGTISVEWSRLARLESPNLFLVQLDDGTVYTGNLSIHPVEGSDSVLVEITETGGSRVAFDKSRIAGFSSTSASFWGRLNGSISSGISYAKGNQTTTYNISSNVDYPRPRWSAGAGFNSNFSNSSGATASTRNQLSLSVGHLMRWNNWYYAGFGSGLQSSEQQITLQTNLGGGIGRYIKKTSNVRVSAVGGLVWQKTNYESGVSAAAAEDMLGVMLLGTVNYVKFKKTTLTLSVNTIPSLSNVGRFYFNTNASYFLKLFGQINWNLSFYGNWDTQPPAGTSGNDYGINSGLSFTFGNQ
jgi:hypothetical protein